MLGTVYCVTFKDFLCPALYLPRAQIKTLLLPKVAGDEHAERYCSDHYPSREGPE